MSIIDPKSRFQLLKDLWGNYLFIVGAYGGAVLADYVIFQLIELLLAPDVQKYALVATWFDYAKIGLALMLIICAVTHGLFSTYQLVLWDFNNTKKEDK